MRKAIYFTLLLLFTFISGEAFSQDYKNSVYVELLGNGFYYSINFERMFFNTPGLDINARIGFATYGKDFTGIPLELNVVVGKRKHCFEAGFGVTPVFEIDDVDVDVFPAILPRLGYRYRAEKSFLFRFGITPIYIPAAGAFPWVGISLGKSF